MMFIVILVVFSRVFNYNLFIRMLKYHRHVCSLRWLSCVAIDSDCDRPIPSCIARYRIHVYKQIQTPTQTINSPDVMKGYYKWRFIDQDSIWYKDNYLCFTSSTAMDECHAYVMASLLSHVIIPEEGDMTEIKKLAFLFVDSLHRSCVYDVEQILEMLARFIVNLMNIRGKQCMVDIMCGTLYRFPPRAIRKFILDLVGADALTRTVSASGDDAVFLCAGLGMIDEVHKRLSGHHGLEMVTTNPDFPIHGTLLHVASYCGDSELINSLSALGAHVNQNTNGWTPLFHACFNGYVWAVKALIEHGGAINYQNDIGMTPLHVASDHAHTEAIKLLMELGGSVNMTDTDKWTALHYASFNGHLEAIQTLIDHGANVDARDNDGATPCHYATDNCQNEAILLLAANGADNGLTPLHFAAVKGDVQLILDLVAAGADASVTSKIGWKPSKYAIEKNRTEAAKLLDNLSSRRAIFNKSVNWACATGVTPLHSLTVWSKLATLD